MVRTLFFFVFLIRGKARIIWGNYSGIGACPRRTSTLVVARSESSSDEAIWAVRSPQSVFRSVEGSYHLGIIS
jgi:hypothetical protein